MAPGVIGTMVAMAYAMLVDSPFAKDLIQLVGDGFCGFPEVILDVDHLGRRTTSASPLCSCH